MAFMENTVNDIIRDWNTTIITLFPLPVDQQNYNPLVKEVVGNVRYNRANISAEKKVMTNYYDNDIEVNRGGDKDGGNIVYSVPTTINNKPFKPSIDDLYYINGDLYRIRSMRDRIGETILILYKHTGVNIDSIDIAKDVIINES